MQFSTLSANPLTKACDCLVVFTNTEENSLSSMDSTLTEKITQLKKSGDFSGKKAETLLLHSPTEIKSRRLLLVGTGTESLASHQALELLRKVAKQINVLPVAQLIISHTHALPGIKEQNVVQLTAQALIEANYKFDQFKSGKKKPGKLKKISFTHSSDCSATAIRTSLKAGKAIGEGTNLARLFGDLPGNICTPTYLTQQAKELAKEHSSITAKALTEKKLQELGMGSLLSVSAGSEQPASLIIMEYQGGKSGDKPVALVGKGVTFDSGGISLKPGAAMDEMKYDMCGAASVFGVLKAVAELQLTINLVAVVPAVENMPSGKATKPGDIVTSMSGQTIEVLNTDAEGRLILCDALTYVERFKPRFTIDIATLTGACVVALGSHASGLFSNDDELAGSLLQAGTESGDRAWRMPLWEDYDKQLKSNFADMANIGGPKAGSVTAACFLSRFTRKQRWAHIDIAGSAWNSGANKGATGRPVALLVEFLRSQAG